MAPLTEMTYRITVICYQGHKSQYGDINTVNLNLKLR